MKLFNTIIFLILNGFVFSQDVLTFSEDMEPICDPSLLSGFVINLPVSNDDGFFDSDDCDGTRENVVYFSFIAWVDQMDVLFSPSSCNSNSTDNKRGIQVSIFRLDENGDPVIEAELCECNDQIEDIDLMLTNLVPGQQYYVFIDGCAGDVCDVTVSLDPSISALPAYSLPVNVDINIIDESGEGIYCDGETIDIVLANVVDASFTFDYTITEIDTDGNSTQQNITTTEALKDTINSNIDSIIYLLDLYNPCDTIRGVSDTLVVSRFPKEVFPNEIICVGDTLFLMDWLGSPLMQPVFYSDTITLPNGCELIQEIEIDNFPISSSTIDTLVCDFPVTILGEDFLVPTQNFRIILENGDANGCDSIIALNVNEFSFDGDIISLDCNANFSEISFVPDPSEMYDSIQLNWLVNGLETSPDTLILNSGETAELSVDVYRNGQMCTALIDSYTSNPLNFTGAYQLSCLNGILTIDFIPDNTDFDQIVYNWTVDGIQFLDNGPQVTGSTDDEFSLEVEVSKDGTSCSFVFGPDQYWTAPPLIGGITPVSCIDDSLSLNFSFTNNSADSLLYFWTVDGQPFAAMDNILVNINESINLTVVAYHDGLNCNYDYSYSYNNEIPCDPSCTPATLILDIDQDTICWNGVDNISVGLSAIANSNMGVTGMGQWLSSDINNDLFVPLATVDSNYVFVYEYIENGDCFARDSVALVVNIIPDPVLSLSANDLCVGDTLVITTDFGPNGVNNSQWFLEEAVIVSGDFNASGEILLSYPIAGSFRLFTKLINESCESFISDTLIINVVEGADDFGVVCNEEMDQITFSWNDQDCIDFYAVTINGQFVENTNDTFYILDQLMPNQDVDIMVEAFEGCLCGNVAIGMMACSSSACPIAQMDFNTTDIAYCHDELQSMQLTVSTSLDPNEYTGTWSGQGISPTGLYDGMGLMPSEFYLYHTISGNQCVYVDSVKVSIYENPDFDFAIIVDSCGDSDQVVIDYQVISAFGNTEMYLDGSLLSGTMSTNSLQDGTHVLELFDEHNCSQTQSFVINSLITTNLDIIGPQEILAGDSVLYNFNLSEFIFQDIESLTWSINDQIVCNDLQCIDFTLNELEDFELCLEVLYNGSCHASLCRDISVYTKFNYFIPTGISPGSTLGTNDDWILYTNQEGVVVKTLQVFDRWGSLVHSLDNKLVEDEQLLLWDGRYGDRIVSPGVYVYLLELEYQNESRIDKGQLTIIR